jgi:hypothetical protein
MTVPIPAPRAAITGADDYDAAVLAEARAIADAANDTTAMRAYVTAKNADYSTADPFTVSAVFLGYAAGILRQTATMAERNTGTPDLFTGPDATGQNCPDCWHLWTLHRKGWCGGKIYPAHSLDGEPCPCERADADGQS